MFKQINYNSLLTSCIQKPIRFSYESISNMCLKYFFHKTNSFLNIETGNKQNKQKAIIKKKQLLVISSCDLLKIFWEYLFEFFPPKLV